jgi:CBS domain-containing protein
LAKSIRNLMTTEVETVTLKDNVYEAAVKMKEWNVGIIPVVDEQQHCIGVITDRDIVVRGIAEKREGSASVEQVMSKGIVTGTPEMTVDEAVRCMADQQIRRLPIVEDNCLVGIVAMADLAVREQFVNEAGQALSQISEPTGQHSQGFQQ